MAIIGRKMTGHVEDVASALKIEGKQVEIFNDFYQKDNIFNIEGTNKTWTEITNEFITLKQ